MKCYFTREKEVCYNIFNFVNHYLFFSVLYSQ
jgi:hypothetical protein